MNEKPENKNPRGRGKKSSKEGRKIDVYEYYSDNADYFRCAEMQNLYVDAHFHASWEFIFVLKGGFKALLDGEEYSVNEGDVLFVPSFVVHYVPYGYKNRCFSLVFGSGFRKDFDEEFKGKQFDFVLKNHGESTEKLFNLVENCAKEFDGFNLCEKRGFSAMLLGLLAKTYPLKQADEKRSEQVVVGILQYIEKNYRRDVTVKKIAAEFGYTKNYLSAVFNRYTGMKFNDYLGRKRMIAVEKECTKSANGTKNITKIALDCGFNSLNTYYRAKKKFGFDYSKIEAFLKD